ncbi:4996_t:CDS:2, partial [Racocetra fulgida]
KYDKSSEINAAVIIFEYSDFDSIGYHSGKEVNIFRSLIDLTDSRNRSRNKTSPFMIKVDWRNPYGELPASDYPKLP